MDILVTTPKSEIDNAKREGEEIENSGGHWFRVFRFKPKVDIGDKIYFTENGLITGYGIIIDLEQMEMSAQCDVTGRDWGNAGDWKVCYNDWHWLKKKVPFKGFQGYRYVERINNLKEQLRDAERQE